ncbi:MAG: FAD-binding oxidoreductase [Parvularculaceae bacterium]|nr:FAD-binding oxidoreductase [Parvularculaceae bacterium]
MNAPVVKGRFLARGAPEFARAVAASTFNASTPAERPAAYLEATCTEDVAAAIGWARREGLKVAVKSGGHSWSQNHLRDGAVVVDVSRLDAVSVDRAAMTATAGPGAPGSETLLKLVRMGLFFPAGHCESVRLGGYLLQGGFGWNGRVYGPACQSVMAIDYVDANGDVGRADDSQNADMLWAARGAGPGFFGVVTRFHLRLYRKPPVIAMKAAIFPLDRALDVFRWAHQMRREIPPSIELNILMSRKISFLSGPGLMATLAAFEESWGAAGAAARVMRTAPRGAAFTTPLLPTSLNSLYRRVMEHYPHGYRYAVDNMWTGAPFAALEPGLARIIETLPPAPSHMLWMNWAPPTGRPDMAFSLEDDVYIALYGVWNDARHDETAGRWAATRMREMAHLSSGVQLADENIGARPAPFLKAAHLERLDGIRAARDPSGLFFDYRARP